MFLIVRQNRLIFFFFLTVLLTACSSEPRFEKGKFERVHLAAQEVKNAIIAGASHEQFGELLKKLSAEISAIEGTEKIGKEEELLKGYRDLLAIYRDGYLLWKYRNEFTRYGFVPKGSIYVGQDVEPVAEKYRIPTEDHVYEPTRKAWKSISEDSIRIVWMNADSQLKIIENILNY